MTPAGGDRGRRLVGAEPAPVKRLRRHGTSPFVLEGEHAGNRVLARLGRLRSPESQWRRQTCYTITIPCTPCAGSRAASPTP